MEGRTIASQRAKNEMTTNLKQNGPKGQPAASQPPHILLAEDDKEMRALLAVALRSTGYEVTECGNGAELLDHLGSFILPDTEHENVNLVISDIRMPGLTGLEILEGLSRHGNFPPFILITAFGDVETHARAKYWGALAIFDKPFDVDDLVAKVRKVVPLAG